eukprot:Transcript_10686.p2 GENE.Transcript_10686~~Transcript_10686.p2  ORF type:complete len:437 (+),score=202.66 Transcript_10686:120-1430(+)
MFGGDEVSAIVMDLGSSCTKSGYAGEDCPKFVIPSSVGVIGGEEAAAQEGPSKRTFHVGTNALAVPREGMRVEGALRDGIVADWDAAEALMEHSLKSCLGCDPTDHPLLLAEPSFNPAANRTKLTELAFEKFQIPALFLSKNAVLAAFAAGRGTAMVLDVGGGATCAAAVHDGYVLNKPLKKSMLGGDLLTEIALKSVSLHDPSPPIQPVYCVKRSADTGIKATASYHKYQQLQVLREVKECVCRANMYTPQTEYPLNTDAWEHELPDRSTLDAAWERFHLPELYFHPTMLKTPVPGTTPPPWLATAAAQAAPPPGAAEIAAMVPEAAMGLPEMVAEAIRACDTDTRRELWGSVVVCGGGSLLPGLTERLHARLNQLVPQMSMKVKLIAPTTPQERRFAVWIGGSILASLGSFQQLWMSKAEYDEQGAQGILRKCP